MTIFGGQKGVKIFLPGGFAPRTPHFVPLLWCFWAIFRSPRAQANIFIKVFRRVFEQFFVIGDLNLPVFSSIFFGHYFVFVFSTPCFDHISRQSASFPAKKVFSNSWEHSEKGFQRWVFLVWNIFWWNNSKLFSRKKNFKTWISTSKVGKSDILKIIIRILLSFLRRRRENFGFYGLNVVRNGLKINFVKHFLWKFPLKISQK